MVDLEKKIKRERQHNLSRLKWLAKRLGQETDPWHYKEYKEQYDELMADLTKNKPIPIKRQCKICGTPFFIDARHRKQYCSPECRKVGDALSKRKYLNGLSAKSRGSLLGISQAYISTAAKKTNIQRYKQNKNKQDKNFL